MKNQITLRDKNNKIIKEGDKVKFFMGTGPSDPFGYWESGIIKFINGIFIIIDGDAEWTAHGKILEIINNSENFLQWIYDRLVNVHYENPDYDYMRKLKEIVDRDNEIKSLQNQAKNHKNCIVIDKPKRESKHQYFLKIARLVSSRSTCLRRSVGCVITNKYGHIKATGYNGVPRTFEHCIDKPCGGENSSSGQGLNSCMATHAEQNTLLQCDNVMDIETIYITTSPCITCAKLIANTSCKEVIYSEEYADTSGIDMLKKLNIKTTYEKINN